MSVSFKNMSGDIYKHMIINLKSPVTRVGGKHFLSSWIVEKIPEHVCYVEPFCGAGHVLFSKPESKVEVLNDVDGHLIGFFQVIKDHKKRQKLIETLQYTPYSRQLWQDLRLNWKQGNIPNDSIEQASQWFYLNRSTFSGDQKRGGFAAPSVTGRNPVQSFRNSVDSLDTVAEWLRNVCIESLDYAECIQKYDSKDTLFFCDPPYYGSEHYYGDSFSQDDHYRLSDMLHSIKGHAMVSHYVNPVYDSLYAGWQRYEHSSFKGSHKSDTNEEKPKTTEVLYCNFKPTFKNRSLFNELL